MLQSLIRVVSLVFREGTGIQYLRDLSKIKFITEGNNYIYVGPQDNEG